MPSDDDIDDFELDLPDSLHEDLTAALRQEFVDDCQDKLDIISQKMESLCRQDNSCHAEQTQEILSLIHSIKGNSSTFGFSAISVIAHRMEDYLESDEPLSCAETRDAYIFIDKIRDLLFRSISIRDDEIAAIVRTLPVRFTVAEVMKNRGHIEALLIMPKNVQQRLIEEEISACGFRVSTIPSPFQALETAALTKPDLIIASAVLEQLDGIQTAHLFRAMEATKDTPFILLTSLSEKKLDKTTLPARTMVARKGKTFPSDFSQCAIELGLFNKPVS